MKNSTLLGGTARIIREPSRKDVQQAMLRRLGAGHILDAEAAQAETDDARVSEELLWPDDKA